MSPKEKDTKTGIRVKDPQKYEYAYLLYMQRVPQKEIADRVGVSQQTLSKWKDDGGWELKRVARTVSRDQIINKTLMKINELLDNEEDFNGDEFAKLSSQLEKIKGGYTMDDVLVHDATTQNFVMHQMLAMMDGHELPLAVGVIRDVEAPTYEKEVEAQVNAVRAKNPDKTLRDLLLEGDTWEVK